MISSTLVDMLQWPITVPETSLRFYKVERPTYNYGDLGRSRKNLLS